MKEINKNIFIALFCTGTIFLGIVFFFWSVPAYFSVRKDIGYAIFAMKNNPDMILENKDFLNTKNYLWPETVEFFVDDYFSGKFASEKNYSNIPLIKFIINKLEESMAYEGNYAGRFFTLGKIYGILAIASPENDNELLKKAGEQFEKALSLYKNKQDILYMYTVNLSNQGKDDEALSVAKNTVDLDPRVLESHYYYGIMLFKKGADENLNQALKEFEIAFNGGFKPKDDLPKTLYEKFLMYYYGKKNTDNFRIVVSRLMSLNSEQTATYQKIIDYIDKNKVIPSLNIK